MRLGGTQKTNHLIGFPREKVGANEFHLVQKLFHAFHKKITVLPQNLRALQRVHKATP